MCFVALNFNNTIQIKIPFRHSNFFWFPSRAKECLLVCSEYDVTFFSLKRTVADICQSLKKYETRFWNQFLRFVLRHAENFHNLFLGNIFNSESIMSQYGVRVETLS